MAKIDYLEQEGIIVVLSNRLMMNIGLVPKGKKVADVGCDHARVPIWLVKHGISPYVIATDLRQGPLAHAKENIRYFHLEDKIETRLSDGLKNLAPSEVEVLLIAGMGGGLCVKILSEGMDVVRNASDLVLQPQSERGKVRHYLWEIGFSIIEEVCCFEDGKFYNALHAISPKQAMEDPMHPHDFSALPQSRSFCEAEYEFGHCLLRKKDPILFSYLKHEYEKALRIKAVLEAEDTDNTKKRLPSFLLQIKTMEEALTFYDDTLTR